MIKKYLLAVLLAGAVCTSGFAAFGQESGPGDQGPPAAGGHPPNGRGHFDPATRVKMMTRQLNLTSDQQGKVLEILKSAQSEMESLRSNASSGQENRRSQMMEIHKSTDDQIRAVLDADQQRKWDAMQSRRQSMQGRGPGGQPQAAPDGSQQN